MDEKMLSLDMDDELDDVEDEILFERLEKNNYVR